MPTASSTPPYDGPPAPAPPHGTTAPFPPGGTPAGAWRARIVRESQTSVNVFHFTGDGRVFLAGGGAGLWTPTGPWTFDFRIAEPLYDQDGPEAGACVAWVDVDQRATWTTGAFRSEGVSVVRDPSGRVLRTRRVTVAALRAPAGGATTAHGPGSG